MSYARNRSSTSLTMAEINITPLVDVLLTVLIIFMVTAPVLTESIPFPLAGTDGSARPEPIVLGLTIRDTGELVLEGQPSSRLALDQRLRAAALRGFPVRLDIRPEARSPYDNLANVLAIAHANEITNLRIHAPPVE